MTDRKSEAYKAYRREYLMKWRKENAEINREYQRKFYYSDHEKSKARMRVK